MPEDQYTREAPYYCPACGLRWDWQTLCNGKAEAGHQPVAVVPTDELNGENHTAAPNTDNLG